MTSGMKMTGESQPNRQAKGGGQTHYFFSLIFVSLFSAKKSVLKLAGKSPGQVSTLPTLEKKSRSVCYSPASNRENEEKMAGKNLASPRLEKMLTL